MWGWKGGAQGMALLPCYTEKLDPMKISGSLVDDFFPFPGVFFSSDSQLFVFAGDDFFKSNFRFFFLEASLGAYADNDDIVPKLRALKLGGLLVKGVPSFIGATDISCWRTPLGDENAGTPQNLKPNKKRSPEPLGYHRAFWTTSVGKLVKYSHLLVKYSHLFHGETNHNRPQSRSIVDVPTGCWKHPKYHLVAKSMDHFTPAKNCGKKLASPKIRKLQKYVASRHPQNWKSRMLNPCKISISDFWAEESFKWVAASPGRYPMAGSQKNSQSKKTIQRKSSKNTWFVQVFGFTFSLSWWQALNKETTIKCSRVSHHHCLLFLESLQRHQRRVWEKMTPIHDLWRELTISFRMEHASPVENLGWIHQLIWAQGLCWQKGWVPPKTRTKSLLALLGLCQQLGCKFFSHDMWLEKPSINFRWFPGWKKKPGNFPDFQVVGVFFAAIFHVFEKLPFFAVSFNESFCCLDADCRTSCLPTSMKPMGF